MPTTRIGIRRITAASRDSSRMLGSSAQCRSSKPRARRDALDLLVPRVGDVDGAWGRAEIGECPDRAAVLAIARAGIQRLPRDFLPIEVAEGRWAA
ncbi:MAG TPA: hypothetical protein VIU11_27685 [Nakamurella sp.]